MFHSGSRSFTIECIGSCIKISIWPFFRSLLRCPSLSLHNSFFLRFRLHWNIRFNHKHNCELFCWWYKLYLWLFQRLYRVIANMTKVWRKHTEIEPKKKNCRCAANSFHVFESNVMAARKCHVDRERKKATTTTTMTSTTMKNINKSKIMRLSWQ